MNKNHLLLLPLLSICFMPLDSNNQQATKLIKNHESTTIEKVKKNKQTIKVKNKTSIPAIGNIFVSQTAPGITAGYYGILLPAQKNKEQTIPEFFWFETQATGGFRKPGEPSKVRTLDVLNHRFANKIEIIIPNDKKYEFTVEAKKYTIIITHNKNGQNQVTLREKKAKNKEISTKNKTRTKSFLKEIEEEIETKL